MTIDKERQDLFNTVRLKLAGSIRVVELDDKTMCALLDLAVGDYAEYVQNFIIENNWAALFGKKTGLELNGNEIAYALSMRSLDLTKDYSQWYSKQVGLQQQGQWELKKDFIKIERGRQVYVVPAGREINKVMWVSPPTTDQALFAGYGGFGVNFGSGVYGQTGFGTAGMFGMSGGYGMGAGLWAMPAYDVALLATDLSYKNQLFRSDLVYKVTAGPEGTHLIHLLSTPGSKLTFGMAGTNQYSLAECYLWYTYYDTSNGNADECRKQNPDVILTPDQVPLDKMDYSMLNSPTKATVRRLLIAHAAETLALARGKFSGQINFINSPLTMDYAQLMSYGNTERNNVITDLKERLGRMTPYETVKRQAELIRDLKEVQKGTPLGLYKI